MATTSRPTPHDRGTAPGPPDLRVLVRRGAIAGAIAAVSTAALAAAARAADVSLEVDGTAIPVLAFAWWTVVGAAVGVVLARSLRDRRRFVTVTVVTTVVSLAPALALPDDAATSAVLVGAHLLAAAIIIPALRSPLADPAR